MKNRILFILFLFAIILYSCQKEKLSNKSIDFTKEFMFTEGIEGPAVDSQGNLYAVNYKKDGTIGIVNKKGESTLFATLPDGSIGNGMRFDKGDNMYIADYTKHNILRIKKGTTEAIVYAHDPILNQPNDIAISPNGTLYASDPNWEKETGNLWMVSDGKFILLEKNMGTTNGIEVGPNGKKLYVNESAQRNIWVYDIESDGTVNNKKLFKSFTNFGMDGMRCDIRGNLYVCRYDKGTVVVLSPNGEIIREITLKGKKPTNIAFGGKDKKQCFITVSDRGCFESFFAEYPGRSF
ncbi:MAG TPA: SMP-30/gluconolactonase/LRE family protein [Flavobacteriaceae bacterium]